MGFCATTVPPGFGENTSLAFALKPAARSFDTAATVLRPTTSGTSTPERPAETIIVTTAPGSTCAPAAGDCEITVSFAFSLVCRLICDRRPACVIRVVALTSVSPIYTTSANIKDVAGAVLGNSPFTQTPTAVRF